MHAAGPQRVRADLCQRNGQQPRAHHAVIAAGGLAALLWRSALSQSLLCFRKAPALSPPHLLKQTADTEGVNCSPQSASGNRWGAVEPACKSTRES